jgi:hypothetical protein
LVILNSGPSVYKRATWKKALWSRQYGNHRESRKRSPNLSMNWLKSWAKSAIVPEWNRHTCEGWEVKSVSINNQVLD